MIFFFVLLVVSLSGIAILYLRRRADCEELFYTIVGEHTRYPALFICFMESVVDGIALIWRTYVWGHILRFTEKRLRWIRIIILKMERFLFRATHRLRNAVQQHENGVAQSENENSNLDDPNNKILPP